MISYESALQARSDGSLSSLESAYFGASFLDHPILHQLTLYLMTLLLLTLSHCPTDRKLG